MTETQLELNQLALAVNELLIEHKFTSKHSITFTAIALDFANLASACNGTCTLEALEGIKNRIQRACGYDASSEAAKSKFDAFSGQEPALLKCLLAVKLLNLHCAAAQVAQILRFHMHEENDEAFDALEQVHEIVELLGQRLLNLAISEERSYADTGIDSLVARVLACDAGT